MRTFLVPQNFSDTTSLLHFYFQIRSSTNHMLFTLFANFLDHVVHKVKRLKIDAQNLSIVIQVSTISFWPCNLKQIQQKSYKFCTCIKENIKRKDTLLTWLISKESNLSFSSIAFLHKSRRCSFLPFH